MNILSLIKNLMSEDEKYHKYPGSDLPPLSPDRKFAISLAGPNSEQTESYVDQLTTGKDPAELADNLAAYWEITDRESALKELKSLLEVGHRGYFAAVFEIIQKPERQWPELIMQKVSDGEDRERIAEYCENLKEAVEDLVKDGDMTREQVKHGIAAWDYARLVNVARFCYDVKYITEEEAWSLIESTAEKAKKEYDSWESYGWSFFLGRCMWQGTAHMSFAGMYMIVKDLLKDPESPWVQTPWKGAH